MGGGDKNVDPNFSEGKIQHAEKMGEHNPSRTLLSSNTLP